VSIPPDYSPFCQTIIHLERTFFRLEAPIHFKIRQSKNLVIIFRLDRIFFHLDKNIFTR
jgi:hypothetical protein